MTAVIIRPVRTPHATEWVVFFGDHSSLSGPVLVTSESYVGRYQIKTTARYEARCEAVLRNMEILWGGLVDENDIAI